jgi:tetratricopeptide (TPR) repeat protein
MKTLAERCLRHHRARCSPTVATRCRLPPTLLLCGLLAVPASDQSSASVGECELALPEPLLERMEAAVRSEIEKQVSKVRALLADGQSAPKNLGAALGGLGRVYHAYGLEDSAVACYQEAERLDPASALWPYYLGFLYQVRGEAREAAGAFERALRLAPDDPPTLLRLARARFDLGALDDAESLFRRTLEDHPANAAAAHAGLARIAGARGQHASAVEHYEAALARQPQATLLHYPLALAYRQLGRTAEAVEHLDLRGDASVTFPDPLALALDSEATGSALHVNRAGIARAEGRHSEAVAEYRLALASDPRNATARYDLGMLLAAGGDLAGAKSELEEARRLQPDNPSVVAALARVLAASGAEQEALPLFRRSVELDPDWAVGHLQLAAALARATRHAEARDAYDRALELDPASTAARLGRAEVLLEISRPAAATEDLEAVLRSEPDNARASLRLGEARQRLGEADAALAAFEVALKGRLEPLERTAALLGAGNLLVESGDLDAAVERYREALKLTPGLDPAESNLAAVLMMLGRDEEAISHYGALLARQPANVRIRTYRAQLLLRHGRIEDALADFDDILAREPRTPAAHLGAAAALQMAGRWGEARRRLEDSVARLPQEPLLAEALARLLASCPEPALRDGDRALRLASDLMTADRSPDRAETLAMALAATGRFEEAAALQRELLSLARSSDSPAALVDRLQLNLERYVAGLPCCADPGAG